MLTILSPHAAFCRSYLDDMLVFSSSLEEHIKRLEAILKTSNDYSLPSNYDKSIFARQNIDWVGHTITPENIHPSSKFC